jgi:Plasmid pRiA4b ORF-3-like protein
VATTLIFRVSLQHDPAILRDIEIPASRKLFDLAKAIVSAFDFDFDHAFGFYSKLTGAGVMEGHPKYELFADIGEETDAVSVKRTRVDEAFPAVGHKMLFLFDYGDDWRFVVEVVSVGKTDPKARYPKLLKKVGASPEQYQIWDNEDDDEEGNGYRPPN